MKPYIFRVAAVGVITCAVVLHDGKARAGADGIYEEIAANIAQHARSAGITRIGVLDFVAVGGAADNEALFASERISANLTTIQTALAERRFLEWVLEDVRNAAMNLGMEKAAGTLRSAFAVEAIVTGVVSSSGTKTTIRAKLNNVKTGKVLFMANAETRREQRIAAVPPGLAPPGFPQWAPEKSRPRDLHDALSDPDTSSCLARRTRIAELNSRLVGQKARYWAGMLNEPFFGSRATGRNPGVEIFDPGIQEKFYKLLTAYLNMANPAGIDQGEPRAVTALIDAETRFLTECGFQR